MNKSILIAAAAAATILSGLTSFTPTAEAGGIRVGFGFPMGSFVARPSRGGYASSGYGGGMCKKKSSPSYASRSRPAPRSEPRVASKPHYEPKVASRSYDKPSVKHTYKETKVASHEYSAPKKSRSVYRAETDETSNTETSDEIETGATGSSALIGVDAKKADVTTVEVPADLPAETPAPAAEVATAETPVVTEAPVVTETPAPVVVEEPAPKKSKTAKKEDCTKYIPSIGVTVSVGC